MAVNTIAPSYGCISPWLGIRLRAWLRGLAYAEEGKRDQRLDLLRGFCVFAMVVDHVGGSSWLYFLTGGNRWLVSAAEGFIFLSGLTMGLVYSERVRKSGLRAAARATLQRATTLYTLTVALTLIFTFLARMTDLVLWTDRELASGEPAELLVGALTLHYTYHGTDVLALYTILVAVTPLIFFLLSEGRTAQVLAASSLLWAGYQLFPEQFSFPWYIRNSSYFPLAAWQVLFVSGLVFGWHRRSIVAALHHRLPASRLAPGSIALLSPLFALTSVGWVESRAATVMEPDGVVGMFAKTSLAPGRLLLFLALFAVAYLVLTVAWAPIRRLLGWLLLPFGETSLYGYSMQLFLLVPLYNLFAIGSEDPERTLANTLGQLGAVLALWLMIRARFLFRVLPR